MTSAPELEALVDLLALGPERKPFTGLYTEVSDDHTHHWRVWRHGHLARIEDPPGTLALIAGSEHYWRKRPTDPEVVTFQREQDDFEFSSLTFHDPRSYWRDWLGEDPALIRSTIEATTHEGRPAWRFLAPFVKGACPAMVVDVELGLVLESSREDVGVFRSWTEVRTDVVLDGAFEYDGTWDAATFFGS